MSISTPTEHIELPIAGMDCAECARHVEQGLKHVDGVKSVTVLLAAERARITLDPTQASREQLEAAVVKAGYRIGSDSALELNHQAASQTKNSSQFLGWGVMALVAAVVIGAAIGEWLGIFDDVIGRLPWFVPAAAIVLAGHSVFRGVIQAALRRQVTSHTLMTIGVIAAAAIGEWTTAALIVFFMRFADYLENLTRERGRQAIKQLTALQPATARVLRDGEEVELPVGLVVVGDTIVIRPGERVPVDGEIVDGQAPLNEASITGESVPVEKTVGATVYAATIVEAGFLKIRATKVGADTTFGRIVRLVEEAESQKAPVQRFADKFSTYYLPAILGIALLTYLVTGDVMNAVAVLVVACACAITIATPVVVLASVGNAAGRGLLIKGGIALEQLAKVDTVVMDKTGTLTLGQPQVTDVVTLNGLAESDLLQTVAIVETRSEHPLARAIVRAAKDQDLKLAEPEQFSPLPGHGVVGHVAGQEWAVGNRRLLSQRGLVLDDDGERHAQELESSGKTVFFAANQQGVAGIIGVADVIRPEVKAALVELRGMGIRQLLLLTGDNERVASAIAHELGLEYRAELLPQDKIDTVKAVQAQGHVVLMVGDGVNDAPALAQANVGMAMGGAGTDVAIEAADVALMRDDWLMVPEAIRIGRRSVRTIRQNLGFTAVYNVVGIGLAMVGILPPVWAAAAQSLPDIGIMLNSSRLMRRS
jgi:Cd2+/Zn2+-exporting ATPase/Cu+-exporting ATPase